MRIEEFDSNFAEHPPGGEPTVFCDVSGLPFTVHGLMREEDGYFRIPRAVAAAVSENVGVLNLHTAGGRVRFCSDADRIVLRAEMRAVSKMPHFALTGSSGFDLYADGVYAGTFTPPYDLEDGYESVLRLGGGKMRTFTVHFPLYSGVRRLLLGFPPGSRIERAPDYRYRLPTVYYGSSITQGGCASRPGNAYPNMLSRLLSCEQLNLGFSGCAKGEAVMAEYAAGLRMAAFVLDYDHNAPDPAHLEATHAAFFETVRNKNPKLPILLLSRPEPNPTGEELLRRDIIKRTYETAVKNGDGNVWFLDGTRMLRLFGGDSGTVDHCHPNDLGFACMAKFLEPTLKTALQKTEEQA